MIGCVAIALIAICVVSTVSKKTCQAGCAMIAALMATPAHAADWIIVAETEDTTTWIGTAAFLDLEHVEANDEGTRGAFSFVRMQESTAGDVVLTDERLEIMADCKAQRLKYLSSSHFAEDGTVLEAPEDEDGMLPTDWIDIGDHWMFGQDLAQSLCAPEDIDPDQRLFRDMTPIFYLRAYLDGYTYGH